MKQHKTDINYNVNQQNTSLTYKCKSQSESTKQHKFNINYPWFSYVENICKFDNIDINSK